MTRAILRWNAFTATHPQEEFAQGYYADTPAGRVMAVRYKYKRHWNAQHRKKDGCVKSHAVPTLDDAKRQCEAWAAEGTQ